MGICILRSLRSVGKFGDLYSEIPEIYGDSHGKNMEKPTTMLGLMVISRIDHDSSQYIWVV
jgi:hypothetical protein